MFEGHSIAVVVPAYKEERHVAGVVASTPGYVDHILVIDDCSPDDTAAAARSVGDPRCEVIQLPVNQGVGGAILTGHRRALELGADVAVVMAGDGQMDPQYLPDLLRPITSGDVQFAKANRFFGPGSFAGMPVLRVVGNIALSFLTKAASGYWNLFDPQNGYTAIHRSALTRLPLDRIATRYDFENDLLIHLNILRVPAADVPIPAVYGDEVSGLRISTVGPRILRRLIAGFWSRMLWKYVMQSFSAVALFFFTGLALLLAGTAAGIWTIAHTLGPPVASAGTVLLSVIPFVSGLQLLLYSLLLDIQESTSGRGGGR